LRWRRLSRGAAKVPDEAALLALEFVSLSGVEVDAKFEPLPNPWYLQVDIWRARSLGFTPTITTVQQA
jgi:UDP-glucose 4-epimerase